MEGDLKNCKKESDFIVVRFIKMNNGGEKISDEDFLIKRYQADLLEDNLRKFEYIVNNKLD